MNLQGAGTVEAPDVVHTGARGGRVLVIDAPLGEPGGWGRRWRLGGDRSGARGGHPTAGAARQ
jgi:hypothetical protein